MASLQLRDPAAAVGAPREGQVGHKLVLSEHHLFFRRGGSGSAAEAGRAREGHRGLGWAFLHEGLRASEAAASAQREAATPATAAAGAAGADADGGAFAVSVPLPLASRVFAYLAKRCGDGDGGQVGGDGNAEAQRQEDEFKRSLESQFRRTSELL